MVKTKLIEARTKLGLSQKQVAERLFMDASNYTRREKGNAKISSSEWEKLANILNTSVEEIYESEDSHFIVCRDNSVGINQGTNNVYTVPEFLLENQKNYIKKLEEEIEYLKNKLSLKS